MGHHISNTSRQVKALPIDTTFKFPSPIPTWPSGGGFGSGVIDLGGLQVSQITTFKKVWATHEGGPGDLGATFFEPSNLPDGFFMLGSYCQPNNQPLFGWVLVGKDAKNNSPTGTLAKPADYTLVWSSGSHKIKQDGTGYIWLPTPPEGYRAVGHVVTTSPNKPSLDQIRCVRADLTDTCRTKKWIWGLEGEESSKGFNVHLLQPSNIGKQELGVSVGTFIAHDSSNPSLSLSCLRNSVSNLSSMPNSSQIKALIQTFSPIIYHHPKEKYLSSSVSWYFKNGALLYKKGEESKPAPIEPNGTNLPLDGSNDGAYWLDLPIDKNGKEKIKKGDLESCEVYSHVKPMLGATFTDIAMWVFYPFNGPATLQLGLLVNIPFGWTGEHVGDWEHVTLRISNFNGVLLSVFFSAHSGGKWVEAPSLEYVKGNKIAAYASLNGHAFYPREGVVLQGGGGFGMKNATAKSDKVFDSGERNVVVSGDYLGGEIVEPRWLNFYRKWGPTIDYQTKKVFGKFNVFPCEFLGEEGPLGPKTKRNWNGNEVEK